MADKPNLNARVYEEDRQRFKSLVKAQQTHDADLFAKILTTWEAQAGATPVEVPRALAGLQQTLNHVADIVRGIWAQAAADRQRLEDQATRAQSAADEQVQAATASHKRLQAELATLRVAHETARRTADDATASAALAEQERRSLLTLTETQAERIRRLEAHEALAAELPLVKRALQEATDTLAQTEIAAQTLRQKTTDLEADVARLTRSLEEERHVRHAEKDHLRQALSEAERELALYKERSEQLQRRLDQP
jgi:chromosome segregation ATPase